MATDSTTADYADLWGKEGDRRAAPQWALPEMIGRCIGQYELLRLIDEGGMGVLFEGRRLQPHQTVAVKIMKPGLRLERFLYESQILARLRHPSIAQLYDAGIHEEAGIRLAYLVMEYVPGARPIDKYATAWGLTHRQRLSLFADVCDAVGHGHRRGIIHRDLKPGNILVDAEGRPRVIDFGIARAIDADDRVRERAGTLIGTPGYMSAEQWAAEPLDLDVRTDVYSLGIVLYRLLCWDAEAPLPEKGGTPDPVGVKPLLRGDLEAIIVTAAAARPDQRYDTASNLAADIRRHLAGQPIAARAGNPWYVLTRLAQRYRTAALLAAFFLLLGMTAGIAINAEILVGAVLAVTGVGAAVVQRALYRRAVVAERLSQQRLTETMQARDEAERERDRATLAEHLAESRRKAHREAARARQVQAFLHETLASVDPYEVGGRHLAIRAVLDGASRRLDSELRGQPEVEAEVRQTLGQAYQRLGLYREAESHFQEALRLHREIAGEEQPPTLRSMNRLGDLYREESRHAEAAELLERTVAIQRRVLGPQHPDTLDSANHLALVYREQGRHDDSEPLYVQTLDCRRHVLGEGHPDTLLSAVELGQLYVEQKRYDEAEPLLRDALERRRVVLGQDHPHTLVAMASMAWMYRQTARYDDAEGLLIEELEKRQRVSGAEHPHTLICRHNLASLYLDQGHYAEAEPIFAEVIATMRRTLPPGHWHLGACLSKHGRSLASLGRRDEAERVLREAQYTLEAALGPNHDRTADNARLLAELVAPGPTPQR